MKVKKLFKDYNQLLKKHRTVEIITVIGDHVYSGLISEIPPEVSNKQINSWSTMLTVRKDLDTEICDEDNQTANIYTWVSVVVWDDDNE